VPSRLLAGRNFISQNRRPSYEEMDWCGRDEYIAFGDGRTAEGICNRRWMLLLYVQQWEVHMRQGPVPKLAKR
jgi:hypothetical protein